MFPQNVHTKKLGEIAVFVAVMVNKKLDKLEINEFHTEKHIINQIKTRILEYFWKGVTA